MRKSTLKDIENEIKDTDKEEESKSKPSSYAPTGSFLLDLVVGGGVGYGYPFGRIVNIVGDTSTGKTFLGCELIAACYHKIGNKNVKWVYDDCESGFTFDTQKLYGFEIMPTELEARVRSNTVQDAYVNIREFAESLKTNQFGIYILDSLDGLKSKEANARADDRFKRAIAERKGKEPKAKQAGTFGVEKPKYLSQEFFPQLSELLEKTNCLLIVISQVRQNINPMSFEKYVRAGGKAMDFYAHTVLWLANIGKMKKKGRTVGVTIKGKTTKSKTPRPYRDLIFSVQFDYGLDDIATCIDFLFDFRTDTGELTKDAKASWNGIEPNLDNLKAFLIEMQIEEWYRKNVSSKLKKSEVLEFLEGEGTNEAIKVKYLETFGKKLSRDELIQYVEDNNIVDELHRRVEEKWEQIEASIKTTRKPKYN